ncbi:hypothetical protein SBA4_2640007 [Candidatus Sulfopaludibacter sp. SbA4]|nr:hypothetical protein SBA4_2640007 [Candidatus Sulfopaludibacter sp. SbA4]
MANRHHAPLSGSPPPQCHIIPIFNSLRGAERPPGETADQLQPSQLAYAPEGTDVFHRHHTVPRPSLRGARESAMGTPARSVANERAVRALLRV